jgi:shikimate kinase
MKSSDELVEQAAGGTSVAQIFEESDEEGFRKAEVCPDLACKHVVFSWIKSSSRFEITPMFS